MRKHIIALILMLLGATGIVVKLWFQQCLRWTAEKMHRSENGEDRPRASLPEMRGSDDQNRKGEAHKKGRSDGEGREAARNVGGV